jgi:hypothetical protein
MPAEQSVNRRHNGSFDAQHYGAEDVIDLLDKPRLCFMLSRGCRVRGRLGCGFVSRLQ